MSLYQQFSCISLHVREKVTSGE